MRKRFVPALMLLMRGVDFYILHCAEAIRTKEQVMVDGLAISTITCCIDQYSSYTSWLSNSRILLNMA